MSEEIKDAVMIAVKDAFKPQQSEALSEMVEKPDFAFLDLSESSLILVEFCMAVEERLGIEVEFEDLADHPTFLQFVDWLKQQKSDT